MSTNCDHQGCTSPATWMHIYVYSSRAKLERGYCGHHTLDADTRFCVGLYQICRYQGCDMLGTMRALPPETGRFCATHYELHRTEPAREAGLGAARNWPR